MNSKLSTLIYLEHYVVTVKIETNSKLNTHVDHIVENQGNER